MGLEGSIRQTFDDARHPHAPRRPRATSCPGPSRPSTTASSARLLWDAVRRRVRDREGRGHAAGHRATPGTATWRRADRVETDRGVVSRPARRRRARLAAGARRAGYQPPDAPLSRGLEVHPHGIERRPRDLDRPRARARRLRLELPGRRRGADRRRLLRPALPRQGPDRRARRATSAATRSATRATGSRTSCARRPTAASSSSATRPGHCLPLTAEGIRTAFYFGIAAGRELRAVVEGRAERASGARALRRLHRRPRLEVQLDAARPEARPAGPAAAARGWRCAGWSGERFVALVVRPLPEDRPSVVRHRAARRCGLAGAADARPRRIASAPAAQRTIRKVPASSRPTPTQALRR